VLNVEAQHMRVVGERVLSLGCAGEVPGVPPRAREAVADPRGQRAAQPGSDPIAIAQKVQVPSPAPGAAQTTRR
jgi:hypothetical protein